MGNLESSTQKITSNDTASSHLQSDADDDEPDESNALRQSDKQQRHHHGGRLYTSEERVYARLASLEKLDMSGFRNIFPKHIIRRSRCASGADPRSSPSVTPKIENVVTYQNQEASTTTQDPDRKVSAPQSTTKDVPEEDKEFVEEKIQEVTTTTKEEEEDFGMEPKSSDATSLAPIESPTSHSTSPTDARSRRSRKLSRKLMDSLEPPLQEAETKKRRVE